MRRLDGLRIVVTRATHQAEELAAPLREAGADVLLLPMVGIAGPRDPAPLREAAAECDAYDWIVFTSANAVVAFAAELPMPHPDFKARIATVGSATREAAERNGFRVSVTPEEYVAESLVSALGRENLAGKRILIPSAAVTRNVVPRALQELGARVEVVEAYRNVLPSGVEERAAEIFREPFPDWVTFASSSAVDNLLRVTGADVLRRVKIASIGPVTSSSLRNRGLPVAAEARVSSMEALVEAILEVENGPVS